MQVSAQRIRAPMRFAARPDRLLELDPPQAVRASVEWFPMCYGIQFTFPPRYADGPSARYATHTFDMRWRENGIEHRLTKPNHPWTNGQVERMNPTLKEATVPATIMRPTDPAGAPRNLPGSLQLRQAPQNAARSHPLRTHLQMLDRKSGSVQAQSTPPHAGTKQLGSTTLWDEHERTS